MRAILFFSPLASVLGPRYTAEKSPPLMKLTSWEGSEKQTLKIKIVKCMGYKIVITAMWKHKEGKQLRMCV